MSWLKRCLIAAGVLNLVAVVMPPYRGPVAIFAVVVCLPMAALCFYGAARRD